MQFCMVLRALVSCENIGFVIDTDKRDKRPETRDWNAAGVEMSLLSREPSKPWSPFNARRRSALGGIIAALQHQRQ